MNVETPIGINFDSEKRELGRGYTDARLHIEAMISCPVCYAEAWLESISGKRVAGYGCGWKLRMLDVVHCGWRHKHCEKSEDPEDSKRSVAYEIDYEKLRQMRRKGAPTQ